MTTGGPEGLALPQAATQDRFRIGTSIGGSSARGGRRWNEDKINRRLDLDPQRKDGTNGAVAANEEDKNWRVFFLSLTDRKGVTTLGREKEEEKHRDSERKIRSNKVD